MSPAGQPMRPFDESLPMALLGAREAAMQHFRPLLSQHDLTEQQWRVLRALSAHDSPVEVTALASMTSLLAPSVTRILSDLASRKLVTREPVPHDQRRSAISLASAGRKLVAKIAPQSEAIYNNIEATFGQRKLADLITELHQLTQQLSTQRGSNDADLS